MGYLLFEPSSYYPPSRHFPLPPRPQATRIDPVLTCISTESEAIAFDKIEMLLLEGADMLLNGISSE